MAEIKEPKQRDIHVNQYVDQNSREDQGGAGSQALRTGSNNPSKAVSSSHTERSPEIEATGRMLSSFDEMDRMMDRMLEGFMPRGLLRSFGLDREALGSFGVPFMGRTPKVDVIDRHQEIIVRAEVPGMEKDDIQVAATGRSVTISGRRQRELRSDEGRYFRNEISRESFQRTVPMPVEIDGARAKATFNNGVLELTLPKVEEAKRHNVPVQ